MCLTSKLTLAPLYIWLEILFADDSSLVAHSMQLLVDIFLQVVIKFSLKVNIIEKIECMYKIQTHHEYIYWYIDI